MPSVASVAVRVYLPGALTWQPVAVATPLLVVMVQPLRVPWTYVPLRGTAVSDNVMAALAPVSVLPSLPSIVTTGCTASGEPGSASPGCVVNTTRSVGVVADAAA